jgi:hypothetical protein
MVRDTLKQVARYGVDWIVLEADHARTWTSSIGTPAATAWLERKLAFRDPADDSSWCSGWGRRTAWLIERDWRRSPSQGRSWGRVLLAVSRATFRLGFPLDDAWIHQTYARNLAATGEWAFVPGEPSGGSTSPLWTMILAVGHKLGLDPRVWAYLLGVAALATAAVAAAAWFRRRTRASTNWVLVVGLTFVLEWHLVWSAASGMELILVVALACW